MAVLRISAGSMFRGTPENILGTSSSTSTTPNLEYFAISLQKYPTSTSTVAKRVIFLKINSNFENDCYIRKQAIVRIKKLFKNNHKQT